MINKALKTVASTNETSENSIRIGIAITPAEKRGIFQLRYRIYVEEMSKHFTDIDHANKLLYDDMDEWAILLYAKIGSELIGTARINIGKYQDFPKEVADFLGLDAFKDCPKYDQFAFVTKIMLQPDYRNSPVLYLLLAKFYEICCCRQIQFVFGFCAFHLISLYEKLGLHRYYKNFELPGLGLLSPIILVVNDIQHLRRVYSPLYRMARQRGPLDIQAVEWFHAKFTRHSRFVNSQTVTEDDLWSMLCDRLTLPPNEAITILNELSEEEAKKFLHRCGSLVPCDPGNVITNQGDVSYTYNILLSGQLESMTFIKPKKEFTRPGQPFGANGLTEHNKHTEDIAAVDSSEILILSGLAFQRFCHTDLEIAHKVIQKMLDVTSNKRLRNK